MLELVTLALIFLLALLEDIRRRFDEERERPMKGRNRLDELLQLGRVA
jgi:hypothetical protein